MIVSFTRPKIKCAERGCKNKVLQQNTKKKVLCVGCWTANALRTAKGRYATMHVAHSGERHEMVRYDALQDFIDNYEIAGMGEWDV